MPPAGLVSFNKLGGVPVYYARTKEFPYGTKGKGPRTVRLEATFKAQLEACLFELWTRHPWGKPDRLVSGGCYVEKAGKHGEGRAIDIDALWWQDKNLVTLRAPSNATHYLGIEAVLRKHFGIVLDFWFGHGHEDHWHVDNGHSVAWTGHQSTVHTQTLFIQCALTYVHDRPVDIDGWCGPETLRAFADATSQSTDLDNKAWAYFVDLTANIAFAKMRNV